MSAELVYADPSFIVKLLLREEQGADLAAEIYDDSVELFTSLISYAETRSGVATNHRTGLVSEEGLQIALAMFERLWRRFEIIEVSEPIVRQAGALVVDHSLSGADAIHVASAMVVADAAQLTFVTWDRRQSVAADALGFDIQPPLA